MFLFERNHEFSEKASECLLVSWNQEQRECHFGNIIPKGEAQESGLSCMCTLYFREGDYGNLEKGRRD
jgi:hypothetical protein